MRSDGSDRDLPQGNTSRQGRRFKSYRAHHLRKIHIVMAPGSRDRNPLVCVVAGGIGNCEFWGRITAGVEPMESLAGANMTALPASGWCNIAG